MNELLKVTTNEQQEPCISGRELHEFLKGIEILPMIERGA